ncbi:MAG: histidine kinase N-terminal domain-containing protein [Deltaproteobacteria bacterium]|nr:histidine kinase N-terminal domain-containing protein [Deltaproteobacteria bacterium]
MKIKTKLYLTMWLSASLLSFFIITRIVAFNTINTETKKEDLARGVKTAVAELTLLLNDYLLNREERALNQWEIRYNSGLSLLQKKEEEEEEETPLIRNIIKDYLLLGKLFKEEALYYNDNQRMIKEGASKKGLSIFRELEDRRISQLLILARSIISSAKRLHDMAAERLNKIYALTKNSAYVIATLIIIITTGFSWKVSKDITSSLYRLQQGTKIVSEGNLNYKIGLKDQDEIGQLSMAFDRMTENLKKMTATREALDKEITERKKIEKALRESEAWFSTALNSVGDGIIATDDNGCVVFVNPVAEALTGWRHEEAKGLLLKDIFNIVNEETGREAENPVARVLREGNIVGLGNHTVMIAKDGARRPVDNSAAPIKDPDGNVIGVILVFHDITERRNAEKKQKETMESKSAFTSMVSHELRTPLTSLREGVSIVSDGLAGPLNLKQKELLDVAKSSADRLARLINEVLDFQTLESGKLTLKMEDNDINEVIRETKEAMFVTAKTKGLYFSLDLDANLPKIKFERDKITQVISNLVSNALKLTEKGGITICTTQDKNVIHVSVKDTGPGIKEEDIPRLFQQYEQLERKVGGTGLGLAISQDIIKMHGGKIWAESQHGQGSTFHFVLPINGRMA